MYAFAEEDIEDAIQPPLSASGLHRHPNEEIEITIDNDKQATPDDKYTTDREGTENDLAGKQDSLQQQRLDTPTGCTRFCSLDYYKQYFDIGESEVISRIKGSITFPPCSDFIERNNSQPDFYGPFWLLMTLVLLLGTVGNLSNYILSKFSDSQVWESYFFKLEHIRYSFCFLYPFGLAVPTGLYFLFKFTSTDIKIKLDEVICLYGYSLSLFLPAVVLCVIPFGPLQWVLMVAAGLASGYFLFCNLKGHIAGVKSLLMGVTIGVQLLLAFSLKITFFSLLSS